ncbi:MAG: LysM peptidoglycan-binding domain-containing protein [Proteobacteria bacterium]|nr:LysM peptidoglycan-binding domain-containing protein [Pseudomonadota bacterium]
MKIRAGVSLFAAVALITAGRAAGQNNADNLGNINGANSIENSKNSSGGQSDNVLDSEELNSNSGKSNKQNSINNSGNIENSGGNAGGNSLNSDLNSDLEGNSQDASNLNEGGSSSDAGDNLNSNLGSDGGNLGSGGGNLGNGGGNGLSTDSGQNGGALNNGTGLNLNGGNKNNSKANTPPPNAAPANPAAANPAAANAASATPPPEAAPPEPAKNTIAGPDAGSVPPPPQTTPPDPNAAPPPAAAGSGAPAAAPLSAAEQRKLAREEKRKARLEFVKKLAESIPALREGEAPLEYTVQAGDTLWDISDQLLDDASWWPKLWVLNPELTDPDKIEPGTRLLFYPATKTEGPELAAKNSPDPFAEPKVDLATLQTFNMDVKTDNRPKGELIDPSSVDRYQNIITVGDPTVTATYMFRVPGFYSSGVDPVGEIVSDANSPLISGQGQNLIARFDSRDPRPGERFMVVRETPVLSNLIPVSPDGNLFTHTGSVGVVRVSSSGYATLVAEDASSHMAPGDLLIPMNKNIYVPINPTVGGRPNQAPAYVVATEGGSYQSAGPGIAVYLQGAEGRNPFQVGDEVELFMPSGSTFGFTDKELTERESVATARIVDASPESAVGVIIRAKREVTAGASTVSNINSIR